MSNNLTLALKIKADLNQALTEIKTLKQQLQQNSAATIKFSSSIKQGAAGLTDLANNAEQATNKLGKTRAGVESISKQLQRLQEAGNRFAGFAGLGFGINAIAQTADSFKNYQARIALVSQSNQQAQQSFQSLMQIANQTGASFASTAELYTRISRSLVGQTNNTEVLQFTKTINQALVVSGAGPQEAQAALLQLSQGLAAGALRGEEFNSVAEQAPVILDMLQKSLGKTRAELRKMAEEGKLTTEIIMTAIKDNADAIEQQYAQMPMTIGRSVNELSNAWLQFVGNADKSLSVSSFLANAISQLAKHFDGLATLVGGALYLVLTRKIAILLAAKGATLAEAAAIQKTQQTIRAKAQIELQAARATQIRAQRELELAKAADAGIYRSQRTISAIEAERQATERLNAAKAKVNALGGRGGPAGFLAKSGSVAMGLLGGPLGVAITAVSGLALTYQSLKAREEELAQQYQKTVTSLQENIDKTEQLIELRHQLNAINHFNGRLNQVQSNDQILKETEAQLAELKQKRELQQQLQQSALESGGFTFGFDDRIQKYTAQIDELTQKYQTLKQANDTLSNTTNTQLRTAFDAAVASGGELAEKLQAIGDANAEEAIKLLTPVIKDAENQMQALDGELDSYIDKVGKEFNSVTMDAATQLIVMREKLQHLGTQAGLSAEQLTPFIEKIQQALTLTQELESAKQHKKDEDYFKQLKEQAENARLTARQIRDKKIQASTLSDEDKKQALAASAEIEAAQKSKQKSKTKSKPYDAQSKNLELNIQYLRLTGQEVKANLLDIESRYNKLIGEFQKAGNIEGINLIKKILPLEQAKSQIDGVQTEINKLFQSQSLQEQRIQAQVQTGLITHLEGQRQLKEVYGQTVAEIEKQLPILEKLAKMPGAQGEQARSMLEQMKLKIDELKNAGNDLEKAFKDGLTQGIQSSLMGLAQGTMTLRDAIKNLALTVLNAMAQIAAQQLAMQASSAISGWVGAATSAMGGTVTAATGGYIRGPGTSTSDSIPARLSDGEFVINAAMVKRYGVGFMHAINRGTLKHFSQGGLVSQPPIPHFHEPRLSEKATENSQSQVVASPVNVQQTLVLDSAELFGAGLNSVEGKRAMLTYIRANRQTLKQELGG
ncbi:tape measure protein [Pasteurella multocida]|uniref:tape measure protein n=1 Tax=Pasteurella multocida TaxID=747 RepID=UPI0029314BB3|nr:tape measure protein [Pasteurella multocida]WNY75975.1 tape measure protein [Pasteurella multocida]